MSLDVKSGSTRFDLGAPTTKAKVLELRAFDGGKLVANRRVDL
jgi:hypothetical protein